MLHESVEKIVLERGPKSRQVPAAQGIEKIMSQGRFRVSNRCTNFAIPTSKWVIARKYTIVQVGIAVDQVSSRSKRVARDPWLVGEHVRPLTHDASRTTHDDPVRSDAVRRYLPVVPRKRSTAEDAEHAEGRFVGENKEIVRRLRRLTQIGGQAERRVGWAVPTVFCDA
jgi:hypothetical protein